MSNPSPEDKNTFTLSTIKYPPALALMVEVGRFLRPRELVIGMFPLLPPALSSTHNSFSSFTSFPYGFFLLFSAIPYLSSSSFCYTFSFVCLFVFSFFLCCRPFCFHLLSSLQSFSPISPLARVSFYSIHQNLVLRPFFNAPSQFTPLPNILLTFGLSVFSWLIFIYLPSLLTWRRLVTKVGTSKRGGKQWQATPKNLPRMQRTRAIPVA